MATTTFLTKLSEEARFELSPVKQFLLERKIIKRAVMAIQENYDYIVSSLLVLHETNKISVNRIIDDVTLIIQGYEVDELLTIDSNNLCGRKLLQYIDAKSKIMYIKFVE